MVRLEPTFGHFFAVAVSIAFAFLLLSASNTAIVEAIFDVAAPLGASRVILGAPERSALINLLRGNVIREVSNALPKEIDLMVYA